jgi:hypothetical protein
MNANDCKVIRREIDESEPGQELRSDVMRHINQCSACREVFESGTKLRQIVASLVPVEAPADFDFRLSARLAQVSGRRSLPWNFSFAIPAVALAAVALIVGGVFMLRRPTGETPRVNAVASTPIVESTPKPAEFKATQPPQPIDHVKQAVPQRPQTLSKRSEVAKRRGNVVAKDFGFGVAESIRNDEPIVATPAQLIFPVQTLSLSVDDGKGVPRTISFPSVSFGSQRVLAGNGSSFQSQNRTNW